MVLGKGNETSVGAFSTAGVNVWKDVGSFGGAVPWSVAPGARIFHNIVWTFRPLV